MAKKVIYVLPGDLIEVRICDPIFDEGANPAAWKLSFRPQSVLVQVNSSSEITVPSLGVNVFAGIGDADKRQLLPMPRRTTPTA